MNDNSETGGALFDILNASPLPPIVKYRNYRVTAASMKF